MSVRPSEDLSGLIAKKYDELYTENQWFQEQYKHTRRSLHESIVRIVQDLNVGHVVDIGCSYGLMVDLLNENNIDACGLDLPIATLKEFHKQLSHATDKFLYGSVENESVIELIAEKRPQAIILIDTLRYIEKPTNLRRIAPDFIIISELSDNRRMRKKRANEFDIKLYSPMDCLQLFPEYWASRIYFYRSRFRIRRPSSIALRTITAMFPSYILVLKRTSRSF